MKRAVFLDRDGVLNEVVRREDTISSPRALHELRMLPGVGAATQLLRTAGFHVFVVTNQPDVARGKLERAVLDAMMERVRSEVDIHDYRACMHDDADACACRKPKTGMLTSLAEAWDVELTSSYLVGDTWKDVAAGRAAGCRTILLRREYNTDVEADLTAEDLAAAARIIVQEAVA